MDFHYILELLLILYLFVEEACVFIPSFQPEAPRLLLPILFFLSTGLVLVPLQFSLLL
jgi:hypothetical protein